MKPAGNDNTDTPATRYQEPGWVETPTAEKIIAGLVYTQNTPTISLIYGGAGLGKTWTANIYSSGKNAQRTSKTFLLGENKNTVYLVTAHAGMSTITSVLCAINDAMGHGGDAYRNDAMTRSIVRSFSQGDLLIVDEAQHLDIKALDQIRYFNDECGIGIAYLGNHDVYGRIRTRGKQAAFMGPLLSRVGFQLRLDQPTEGDVRALLKAWGIEGSREIEYGTLIGCTGIGLRGLTQVLRQAALIAESLGRDLDFKAMRTAVTNLGLVN